MSSFFRALSINIFFGQRFLSPLRKQLARTPTCRCVPVWVFVVRCLDRSTCGRTSTMTTITWWTHHLARRWVECRLSTAVESAVDWRAAADLHLMSAYTRRLSRLGASTVDQRFVNCSNCSACISILTISLSPCNRLLFNVVVIHKSRRLKLWIRNWSHIATHLAVVRLILVLFLLLRRRSSKKPKASSTLATIIVADF